jgi:uncharacterized protein
LDWELAVNWFLFAGIIAGILFVDLSLRLYFARFVLRIFESPLPLHVAQAAVNDDAERIEFPTTRGLTLRGSLHWPADGPPRGLIVFCPELNGCHWSATSYCAGPLRDGMAVLSFDFRNHGESEHEPGYVPLHWLTDRELSDVKAAVRYARNRGDLKDLPMGMMGVSRGAGAALAFAARDPGIRRVAVEGVFSTSALHLYYAERWASMYVPPWVLRCIPRWHIKGTLALSRLLSSIRRRCRYPRLENRLPRLRRRPVMMIAGNRDSYVPSDIPKRLANRIGGDACELWIVPKAKHNRARNVCPELYDTKVGQFFAGTLPETERPSRIDEEPVETRKPEHAVSTSQR